MSRFRVCDVNQVNRALVHLVEFLHPEDKVWMLRKASEEALRLAEVHQERNEIRGVPDLQKSCYGDEMRDGMVTTEKICEGRSEEFQPRAGGFVGRDPFRQISEEIHRDGLFSNCEPRRVEKIELVDMLTGRRTEHVTHIEPSCRHLAWDLDGDRVVRCSECGVKAEWVMPLQDTRTGEVRPFYMGPSPVLDAASSQLGGFPS